MDGSPPVSSPPSVGFSRQEYCSGLPRSPSGNLPDPGSNGEPLKSAELAGGFFTTDTTWGAPHLLYLQVKQGALMLREGPSLDTGRVANDSFSCTAVEHWDQQGSQPGVQARYMSQTVVQAGFLLWNISSQSSSLWWLWKVAELVPPLACICAFHSFQVRANSPNDFEGP